ncbi:hypothetical protein PGQ11_002892 [Apiospora arundinis]|uniref:Uncharacterized protein n=1 Tax=Apiospora arundinis TaxID=335852 RepID=A0ABR2J4C0_9PEZI
MARGLGWEKYFPVGLPQQISLEDLRLAEASIDRRYAPLWEIGLSMASIALHFGTRAPMRWIIEQLFHDLFKPKYYETSSSLRLRCNNGSLEIGIEEFWEEFNEGVDFVLVDWLTDPNLLQGFEEYEEEKDRLMWRLMDEELDGIATGNTAMVELEAEFDSLELEAVRWGL